MYIHRPGRHGCLLCHFFRLFFDFRNLTFLQRKWSDFHSEDNSSVGVRGEGGYDDFVLLGKIGEDKVFKFDFRLYPLFLRKGGPDVIGLCQD